MALNDKKYERIFSTTGSDSDKISSDELAEIKGRFDNNEYLNDKLAFENLGPILYQLQQMQDELDALRTEISNNKDKTGISTSQANAITANTAKTGISTSQASAITANTSKVSFPVLFEEGNSLSFAVDGANLTIANAWTNPETGKSRTFSIRLTLK